MTQQDQFAHKHNLNIIVEVPPITCFESIETGKVYIFHAEKIQSDLMESKPVGLVLDWYDLLMEEK
jgi:hypothetical protein